MRSLMVGLMALSFLAPVAADEKKDDKVVTVEATLCGTCIPGSDTWVHNRKGDKFIRGQMTWANDEKPGVLIWTGGKDLEAYDAGLRTEIIIMGKEVTLKKLNEGMKLIPVKVKMTVQGTKLIKLEIP